MFVMKNIACSWYFTFIFNMLFCSCLITNIEAQSKLDHWGKQPVVYVKQEKITAQNYSLIKNSVGETLSNLVILPYHVFISDVDGDRCPFHPTCSAFYMQACRQTNIVQGTLMLFDRLTRDANVIDRSEHYKYDRKTKRLIDPVSNYRLRDSLIVLMP